MQYKVGLRADNQKLLRERNKLRRLLQEREEDVSLMRSQLNKSRLARDSNVQAEAAAERGHRGDGGGGLEDQGTGRLSGKVMV